MKLFGEFAKVEEHDDGTLQVSGYASSEAVDSDGETIKSAAIASAIPDYMRFGAVREMHQPKAAGTALEMRVEDDGRTFFVAKVVDAEAVKKVKARVYKGFSIGGRVTARDDVQKSIITGIALTEVSLVDRPANPEAVFTMYKVDGAVDGIEPDATATDDTSAAPASGAPVAKGLDTVACLADILQRLQWIASDSAWEAEWEGDHSAIPGRLKAWLGVGAALLADMSAEEAAEAVAAVPDAPPAPADPLALAAPTGDVAKGDTPAPVPNAPVPNAPDDADPLAKRFDAQLEAALAKHVAPLVEKLDAATAANDALVKRIADLEAQPAAPKGVRTVTKAQDGTTDAPDPAPVDDSPFGLIKAAHARPIPIAR